MTNRNAGKVSKKLAAVTTQRDELLAALQAIQDHGADFDLYAEAAGRWSIREKSGERTIFRNIHEAADALAVSARRRAFRRDSEDGG